MHFSISWMKCKVSKFADDTKVSLSVRSKDKFIKPKSNLDRLLGWVDKWHIYILSNSEKC